MYALGRYFAEVVLGVPDYDVGSIVMIDGKKAKIISGQFFSNGRVSNHWTWKFYTKSGKLSRTQNHGYGGDWKVIKNASR